MVKQQQSVTPLVSVVVIVLNGADTIGTCLDSLIVQTYPKDRYEIVVVDNGSGDETVDIVRKYPVKLIHEPVHGYAPARNAGAKASQGEIVAYMDADCAAEPDWLATLVHPHSDPAVGLVGGSICTYPSEEPTRVEEFIDRMGFVGPPKHTTNGIVPYITTANVSYRKALLEKANMFDTSLPSCEDVDLSRRMQLVLGAKAVLVPEAIVYHRHHRHPSGLFKLMRRNGYGEIIMATRWKGYSAFQTDVRRELKHLLKQIGALGTYISSFVCRSLLWPIKKKDVSYVLDPLLWLLAESATILGKIEALIDTRMLQRVPGKEL